MNANRIAHTHRILIAVALFATAACSRQSLLKGQPYIPVLERALRKSVSFPRGRVQIMSGLSSQMEATDWVQMKFPAQYLDFLQRARKDGLLNLAEEQQGPLDSIRNMGARFFSVSPTDKLLKMDNKTPDTPGLLTVLTAEFKVLQILKDQEYKPPVGMGGAGDEFRLVLGTGRRTPTQDAITLGQSYCAIEPQELKFRSVLQFNPFAKTYTFVDADLGRPQDSGWESENVK